MNPEDRWLPLRHPFRHFSTEVDRLFNDLIHRPWGPGGGPAAWSPSIDILETSDAFVVEADLPGMKREDIEVRIEGDELVLSGTRNFATPAGRYHSQERYQGFFLRRLKLPTRTKTEAIEATFIEGVLRISIPKPGHESR